MEEWRFIANWLWLGLLGLIKILWDKQEERFRKAESKMSAIEEKMYSKEDAKERHSSINALLEDRRQDVIALHSKIDREVSTLRGDISTLGRDMHNGFSEIKTLLIEKLK